MIYEFSEASALMCSEQQKQFHCEHRDGYCFDVYHGLVLFLRVCVCLCLKERAGIWEISIYLHLPIFQFSFMCDGSKGGSINIPRGSVRHVIHWAGSGSKPEVYSLLGMSRISKGGLMGRILNRSPNHLNWLLLHLKEWWFYFMRIYRLPTLSPRMSPGTLQMKLLSADFICNLTVILGSDAPQR